MEAARCRAASVGLAAEAPLLATLLLARRARAARRWADCSRQVMAALGRVAATGVLPPPAGCEPVRHSHGGFFTAIVDTADGPRFVKAVPQRSREARFWQAWRRGAVRDRGAHYRLVPPVGVVQGRVVCILVFPALPGLEAGHAKRLARFRRHALEAVRALADFNSDHPAPPELLGPARGCGPVPAPGRRRIAAALKLGDRRRVEALAAELRAVEAGWGPVRAAVEAGDRCLCHMDLGVGNVAFGDPPAVLLDFGHAGTGAVGADLHTVLRNLDCYEPGPLLEAYAAVFEAKGLPIDAATLRRGCEAHYAARYRDLRFFTSRNPESFETALAVSRRLIGEARG